MVTGPVRTDAGRLRQRKSGQPPAGGRRVGGGAVRGRAGAGSAWEARARAARGRQVSLVARRRLVLGAGAAARRPRPAHHPSELQPPENLQLQLRSTRQQGNFYSK